LLQQEHIVNGAVMVNTLCYDFNLQIGVRNN